MISLIIPAHNEAELIAGTLSSVNEAFESLGIDPSQREVIVVNDASTDNTAAIARANGARVIDVELRHIAAVRNAGARVANGDRLVFLDADTVLPAETLGAALRALDSGAIGGGCTVAFNPGSPLVAIAVAQLWNMLSRVWRWAAGSFVFVRRADFEAVGGFDERYFAAEEIVLSMALKRRGPFTILPKKIHTSERKMYTHTATDHLWLMVKTLATGGAAIRRRDGLGIWYGEQRTGEPADAAPRSASSS